MKKAGFFGEILIDLIQNKNGLFEPVAGGSILNTACTYQLIGGESVIFSIVGNDYWGNWLIDHLNKSNIETKYIIKQNNYKTPLAFAFINENGDAKYEFYKYPYDKNYSFNFDKISLFHIASFFSILPENQKSLKYIFKEAKKRKIILNYDPNIRKNFPPKFYKYIYRNFINSNIIKCSIEDMKILFGDLSIEDIFIQLEKFSPSIIIITLGKDGAAVKKRNGNLIFVDGIQVEKIIDTIGAGDNFTAGYLYYLYKNNIDNVDLIENIDDNFLIDMIKFANKIGGITLKYRGAKISRDYL